MKKKYKMHYKNTHTAPFHLTQTQTQSQPHSQPNTQSQLQLSNNKKNVI
jgi:hypothetical protein